MKLIDISAGIGPYAFRRLRHQTAPELLALMNRNGIDRAVVASNASILYRDTQSGNEELRDAIAGNNRFVGVATINPLYAGWREDMTAAVRDWGFKAVRLLPTYHGYDLLDPTGQEMLGAIAELNVPVALPQRIEDRRQQHAWDRADDLSFDNVVAAVSKQSKLKLMLLNWLGVDAKKLSDAGLADRVLIDINRFDVTLYNELEKLIEQLSAGRFAFGTHMPFSYAGPALLRMEVLRLSAQDKQRIAWQNAAEFLDLKVSL